MMFKAKAWVQWHNKLGWWALAAMIIWVLSAASHPLMSWLGPKAKSFFPPTMQLKTSDVAVMPTLLTPSLLEGAKLVKVVPTGNGPMLQLTKGLLQPKEYYALATGKSFVSYDEVQAAWLGEYYTGRAPDEIESITLISEFSSAYPWVNRLLPVYKIRYKGGDGLTAFVHTETAALASLNNNTKAAMQWFFQHLHTFKFLNGMEWGRLIVSGLFMLTLMAMAVIGFGLVFLLKSRKIKNASRRYHRFFAYILWLPLLAWSASGFYHLLQSSLIESPSGLRLGNSISLDGGVSSDMAWVSELDGKRLNSLSLIQYKDSLFYRVSVSPVQTGNGKRAGEGAGKGEGGGGGVSRAKKYKGVPTEKKSLYVDASTGAVVKSLNDRLVAQSLALEFSGRAVGDVEGLSVITRFGPKYDFRNKRLPVWRVAFKGAEGLNVFIDPSTGILVDQSKAIDRAERWSFTYLHKWNFLTPFTGRFWRDVSILGTLSTLLLISILGGILLLNKKRL